MRSDLEVQSAACSAITTAGKLRKQSGQKARTEGLGALDEARDVVFCILAEGKAMGARGGATSGDSSGSDESEPESSDISSSAEPSWDATPAALWAVCAPEGATA